MHATVRWPMLPGLLLAAASVAWAESPMPEPIAPAVVGRPLDQIKPAPSAREKRAAPANPARPRQAAAPAPATKTMGAARSSATVHPQHTAATPHVAKQALDDRVDTSMRVAEVGTGTHPGRKPLQPGVFFADRHRTEVRKYYQEHPAAGAAGGWRIGEPVPRGTALVDVPSGLRASLPPLPPGYRYVQLGGEVVMVASASRLVVDGISRNAR